MGVLHIGVQYACPFSEGKYADLIHSSLLHLNSGCCVCGLLHIEFVYLTGVTYQLCYHLELSCW